MAKQQRVNGGEETSAQAMAGVSSQTIMGLPDLDVIAGTYANYRRIRNDPTVALARVASTAPIRAAAWGVEGNDQSSDDMIDLVRRVFTAIWPQLIKDALFALDYGWMPFEKVWDIDRGMMVYRKIKPLLVDLTEVRIDDKGTFMGLQNKSVALAANKCFVYTYDAEAGNVYGRSRHENIKSHWAEYEKERRKQSQYTTKVSGVIPMVHYPPGKSHDATGREVDNFEIAKSILNNLGRGNGVTMPNTLAAFAEDLARYGSSTEQLRSWIISFLETKGTYGADFVASLRHKESLMMRGWLVPERTATEGQHGTLAESESHASLALLIADLTYKEIVRYINWYLVDPMLVQNWGPDAAGVVYITPEGLDKGEQEFFRSILDKVLTAPANVDMFLTMVDLDTMLDTAGVPKATEIVNAADLVGKQRKEEPPDGADDGSDNADDGSDDDTLAEKASRVGGIFNRLFKRK